MEESGAAQQLDHNTSPSPPSPPPSPPSSPLLHPCLEELTRRTRDLRPDHLPGAVLKLVRPLSSHFQLSHSLCIPETLSDGYYTYGGTYVGNILNDNDANPILNGEISPSGIFSGVYINKLSKNILARINGHFSNGKWLTSQVCIDRQTERSAMSLAVDKFNPFSMSGILIAQFIRKINTNLSVGFDVQGMRKDSSMCMARYGLVGHVKKGKSEVLLNVANRMPYISANVTQSVDIAPEYKLKCFLDLELIQKEQVTSDAYPNDADSAFFPPQPLPTPPSSTGANSCSLADTLSKLTVTGSIGYNFKIPQTGFNFKAAAKSDGSFISSAEYRVGGLPLTFGISSLLSHKLNRFSTGFRVTFGQ